MLCFSIIPWKKLKNQSKDGIWKLRVLSTCSMNSQSLPSFSGINSLKNGKSEKIWHDKVGYIPLAGWILRNCPASLEFTKKMENLSKDGIRELRVISTCSMNSQSLPCFFGINSSKNGKSGQRLDMTTWDIFHFRYEFSQLTPFFWNSLK